MSDRAAREKAFWDEAYRVEGPAREKHLWSKFITEASYSEDLFGALLGEFVGQRILTLGGGVDTVGVSLSKNNNRAGRLLRPLGRLDSSLVNDYLTPLKYLSTYVLIQATK